MFRNKYSSFLTVLLVTVIIAVIAGLIFLGITIFRQEESPEDAIDRFDGAIQNNVDGTGNDTMGDMDGPEEGDSNVNGTGGYSSSKYKKQYYNGFVMIGYIEISKTGIKYPILETGTDKSLEAAVAVMWPENPALKLNKPGNVVIMGHNYRNGKFFSDNKKLSVGDKIKITDINGKKLTYTIYEKYETKPEDTKFITRNTKGKTEISLSTCTDDTLRRLIIKAKAD